MGVRAQASWHSCGTATGLLGDVEVDEPTLRVLLRHARHIGGPPTFPTELLPKLPPATVAPGVAGPLPGGTGVNGPAGCTGAGTPTAVVLDCVDNAAAHAPPQSAEQ